MTWRPAWRAAAAFLSIFGGCTCATRTSSTLGDQNLSVNQVEVSFGQEPDAGEGCWQIDPATVASANGAAMTLVSAGGQLLVDTCKPRWQLPASVLDAGSLTVTFVDASGTASATFGTFQIDRTLTPVARTETATTVTLSFLASPAVPPVTDVFLAPVSLADGGALLAAVRLGDAGVVTVELEQVDAGYPTSVGVNLLTSSVASSCVGLASCTARTFRRVEVEVTPP